MRKYTLFFIIAVSIFFRFFLLQNVPPSASLDEASIGWNAYSILQTGKDEYGNSMPILLRAYDDYRPAGYVYFVIPFVKLFGLNVTSVRLPSVLFSILTVIAVYFLVRELFKTQKVINSEILALLTSFLVAISPWHVYISRLGHEVNLAFSFFIFALLFFLKRRVYLSVLFFVLSFISYQSEKIFIPVMIVFIFLIFKKEVVELKKKFLIAGIVGFILLTPFIKTTFSPDALLRFKGTNIFDANRSRFIDQSILLQKSNNKDLVSKVLYNRRLLSLQLVSEAYLSHFNPVWLFTNPTGDRHKVPNLGLLYFWMLPFILIGAYRLVSGRFDSKSKILIFVWILSSPLSASVTTDYPHALRSLTFIPTLEILAAIGLIHFYSVINKNLKNISLFTFVLLAAFSMVSLYKNYFEIFPIAQSKSFQYAISKAIPYVVKNEENYKKIVFANNDNLYQSYMFFLFYTMYDPALYQKQGGTRSGGYSAIHKFGKYEFRSINIGEEPKGNLYVANSAELKLKGTLARQIKTQADFRELNDEIVIKAITKQD